MTKRPTLDVSDSPTWLTVVSHVASPDSIQSYSDGKPKLTPHEEASDALDDFNHPRLRRTLILLELNNRKETHASSRVEFVAPQTVDCNLDFYSMIHEAAVLEFLMTAWFRWDALGVEGRDEASTLNMPSTTGNAVPPLILINVPLRRDVHQRPSKNVMGQIGYYCTDTCTPIFESLLQELLMDASIVKTAVEVVLSSSRDVAYALPIHPGHHAARDSFGGYCYVNHAASAARYLQDRLQGVVAILDIDYHCGNGTASIFYKDPSVLVASIHCDPDWEYPFHSGYSDQMGDANGVGTTLHLPLPPGSKWNTYEMALNTAMDHIESFGARAIVVSLGLDTYDEDPCAIRRAGFCLSSRDYSRMGRTIGSRRRGLPTVFIQEGGYRMDVIGQAAADVALGCSFPETT